MLKSIMNFFKNFKIIFSLLFFLTVINEQSVYACKPNETFQIQDTCDLSTKVGLREQREYYEQKTREHADKFLEFLKEEHLNELVYEAFNSENFEAASFFAGQISKKLEIRKKGNVEYRHRKKSDESRDFGFEQDGEYVYFYKAIRKNQLENIAAHGLDSAFGSRGGAQVELVQDRRKIIKRDAGRQYMLNRLEDTLNYADILKRQYQEPTVILRVRIPVEETLDYNLTESEGGITEYFIAGNKIAPEMISYLEGFDHKLFTEMLQNLFEEEIAASRMTRSQLKTRDQIDAWAREKCGKIFQEILPRFRPIVETINK
jgi:hypothetical protein